MGEREKWLLREGFTEDAGLGTVRFRNLNRVRKEINCLFIFCHSILVCVYVRRGFLLRYWTFVIIIEKGKCRYARFSSFTWTLHKVVKTLSTVLFAYLFLFFISFCLSLVLAVGLHIKNFGLKRILLYYLLFSLTATFYWMDILLDWF